MQTSAATDRAKDLEIQKLRADVAELVAVLRKARVCVYTWSGDPREPGEEIDAILEKHGGQ